ncbi:superoxide dismutase family protein [Halomonas borealis]|uniref:superoxide dismutase family protein n=1 Tax=Halomonas borealis TaxID=2508710 RepID=UPI00109F4C00|nr:superoxide dismutase family protein [Halomonas borealis]
MMRIGMLALGLGASLWLAGTAQAASEVELHSVDAEGVGESIGTLSLENSPHGLLVTPDLGGLEPGLHGLHVHQTPSCEPAEKGGETVAAASAGGHYDPQDTGTHAGPYGEGHLGDLPVLAVDAEGEATTPLLAPRLEVADLAGRAVMVHAGGDNYSDEPKLGGGGARVACGVIDG